MPDALCRLRETRFPHSRIFRSTACFLHRKDHLYDTSLWLRLLVIAAGAAAVVLPEVIGVVVPVRLIAQSRGDAETPKFEVASVKVSKSGSAARGVSVIMRELRPHLERTGFIDIVRDMQQDGYILAYLGTADVVLGEAGFRIRRTLFCDKLLSLTTW